MEAKPINIHMLQADWALKKAVSSVANDLYRAKLEAEGNWNPKDPAAPFNHLGLAHQRFVEDFKRTVVGNQGPPEHLQMVWDRYPTFAAKKGIQPEDVEQAAAALSKQAEIRSEAAEQHRKAVVEMDGRNLEGYQVTLSGNVFEIRGPFTDEIHSRIKRLGGMWVRELKGWEIPTAKVDSFPVVFANAAKATRKRLAVEAEQQARLEAEAARSKEKAAERRQLEEQERLRQKAEAEQLHQAARAKLVAESPALTGSFGVARVESSATHYFVSFPYEPEERWFNERKEEIKRIGGRWNKSSWEISRTWFKEFQAILARFPEKTGFAAQGGISWTWHEYISPEEMPIQGDVVRRDGIVYQIIEVRKSKNHDDEWDYTARAVPAADEVRAGFEAREAAMRVRVEASRKKAKLANQIQQLGLQPPPMGEYPQGETIASDQNLYGGGSWFILGSDAVWFVLGNSADGDDWSRNNLPGSIGWRTGRTDELVGELLELDTKWNQTPRN